MQWVLGGWQWTGVMQFQTGRPYTVTSGTDNSLDGIGNDRAKLTGVPSRTTGRVRTDAYGSIGAAFAVNDLGTFGNVGKGAYYGPILHTWDMGLSRTSASARRTCSSAWSSSTSSTRSTSTSRTRPSTRGNSRLDHAHRPELRAIPGFIQFGLKFTF